MALPTHATFMDSMWLASNGGVRVDNALTYFARSPFFKQTQNVDYQITPTQRFDGAAAGGAFVVRRRIRKSAHVVEVEAVYYILDGTVYQCPGIDELATSRLSKCSYHLSLAFDAVRELCEPEGDDTIARLDDPFGDLLKSPLDDASVLRACAVQD
ncbi:hypothetical protein M885DRAFT_507922 [Pelagophyceae sp. CCMP2097]|nr:hypothetical protein M885DRAFT_507922 [Pelagophyceae sp. CCMP2097]